MPGDDAPPPDAPRFGPVEADLDLPALEERTLARWQEEDLPATVRASRAGAEPWIFYEGPPTANGRPGLHHVWARVFKDVYPRFRVMQGYDVPRKGGWDCHGLPVELEVEKELGLGTKQEIEAYGIEAFNERCRASVQRYLEDWSSLTTRSGVWIDTEDAYWTLSDDYIESVWWLVKQMWDRGLLYEGHRVVPYCARCGTALSSHEVAQGYQDVVDPSVYVRFPVVDHDVDLLIWTTTPWTLLSNVAAAVGPDIEYVQLVAEGGERPLVMATAAAERLFPDVPRTPVGRGADLVGWRYHRPFDHVPLPPDADAHRVVAAGFVATDDGSGIVHLAPAFGEDDAAVGRAEGLPVLNPVGEDGTFDAHGGPWSGTWVKDADHGIVEDLRARGLLVLEVPYEHSYPHCWRCGTPLIYWAKTSWFARTADRRTELLRENETIGWHPEHLKHGRFGKWLEGNVDWALSRDRYWGTPLPVWRCPDDHDTCVGSVAELAERSGQDLSELDLHRPHVDEVRFPCAHDGCDQLASRVGPVLDAWFDSGSMPSAQHHHPFDESVPFSSVFPADFICEAIDQTRGWFYSLLAVNTLVFDRTPYRNVVCLGHIVDEDGQKMSKSRGNVVDPWDVFARFGADALRWYFLSSGQPWSPRRVFDDGIRESTSRTLVTLWNVYSFFVTYADLDGWHPERRDVDPDVAPSHVLDRWVRSELDDTIAVVTDALERFDALTGATRLERFVDDLSNWYVRRSRPRFWKSSDPAAHATLHRCLVELARMLAPYCPFLADELHRGLVGTSVHLARWPAPAGLHDQALGEEMSCARRLVTLGRAARTEAKVGVRQPLQRALLLHPGGVLGEDVRAEICGELNVKQLEDIDSVAGVMSWVVLPRFKVLGPRLGAKVNEIKAVLADADGTTLKDQLDEQGWIEVAGERLVVDELEVRARRHEAFALAEEGGWAVALDLELDDELVLEGLARQLVREVNELRKQAGLALDDRIVLSVGGDDAVQHVVAEHGSWVAAEVLATELVTASDGEHQVSLGDAQARVGLRKAGPG